MVDANDAFALAERYRPTAINNVRSKSITTVMFISNWQCARTVPSALAELLVFHLPKCPCSFMRIFNLCVLVDVSAFDLLSLCNMTSCIWSFAYWQGFGNFDGANQLDWTVSVICVHVGQCNVPSNLGRYRVFFVMFLAEGTEKPQTMNAKNDTNLLLFTPVCVAYNITWFLLIVLNNYHLQ